MWQHVPVMMAALASGDKSCSKPIINGGPGLYDYLCSGGSVSINSIYDLLQLITNLIAILLWLSGALAVIFIIVGGIYFVISSGDPSRIKRAREIITGSVTGLVIILIALAVVTFIAGGI